MIHMYKETSQPPEPYFGWGPSLLGAEFVRGRVCQGPNLLGAEMSRNQKLLFKNMTVQKFMYAVIVINSPLTVLSRK